MSKRRINKQQQKRIKELHIFLNQRSACFDFIIAIFSPTYRHCLKSIKLALNEYASSKDSLNTIFEINKAISIPLTKPGLSSLVYHRINELTLVSKVGLFANKARASSNVSEPELRLTATVQ